MTPLADRIPTMSDTDLASLRANAAHLAEHGSANQMVAASDVMPVIDTEVPLARARDAFERLDAGTQFGKVVVTTG